MYLQLQLQAGIRNHFQQLEAHIPFYGLQVSIVKPSSSVGSVSVQSGSTLVWNVGSKFPTKLLNATLSTVCKLRRKIDSSAEQEVGGKDMNGWEQFTSSCALVTSSITTSLVWTLWGHVLSLIHVCPKKLQNWTCFWLCDKPRSLALWEISEHWACCWSYKLVHSNSQDHISSISYVWAKKLAYEITVLPMFVYLNFWTS